MPGSGESSSSLGSRGRSRSSGDLEGRGLENQVLDSVEWDNLISTARKPRYCHLHLSNSR